MRVLAVLLPLRTSFLLASLPGVVFVLIGCILGVCWIVKPESIAAWELRRRTDDPAKPSANYIFRLRASGVFALIMCVIVTAILIRTYFR